MKTDLVIRSSEQRKNKKEQTKKMPKKQLPKRRDCIRRITESQRSFGEACAIKHDPNKKSKKKSRRRSPSSTVSPHRTSRNDGKNIDDGSSTNTQWLPGKNPSRKAHRLPCTNFNKKKLLKKKEIHVIIGKFPNVQNSKTPSWCRFGHKSEHTNTNKKKQHQLLITHRRMKNDRCKYGNFSRMIRPNSERDFSISRINTFWNGKIGTFNLPDWIWEPSEIPTLQHSKKDPSDGILSMEEKTQECRLDLAQESAHNSKFVLWDSTYFLQNQIPWTMLFTFPWRLRKRERELVHCGLESFPSFDEYNLLWLQKNKNRFKSKDPSIIANANGTTRTTEEATNICLWFWWHVCWHSIIELITPLNSRGVNCAKKTVARMKASKSDIHVSPSSGRPEANTKKNCGRPRAQCGNKITRVASTILGTVDERSSSSTDVSQRDVAIPPPPIPPSAHPPAKPTSNKSWRKHKFIHSSFPKTRIAKCADARKLRKRHTKENPDDWADRFKIAVRCVDMKTAAQICSGFSRRGDSMDSKVIHAKTDINKERRREISDNSHVQKKTQDPLHGQFFGFYENPAKSWIGIMRDQHPVDPKHMELLTEQYDERKKECRQC